MCIPYPPPLQTSVGFISVVFVNFANHRQRDYKWFKITSNTIDKRATIRDKIIAKLSLASLLLRGPQCWCKHSFSLLFLSNVIIIHMSLVALNKYDWQNFIQQGITRKVKKIERGYTCISESLRWSSDMCIPPCKHHNSPPFKLFDSCKPSCITSCPDRLYGRYYL